MLKKPYSLRRMLLLLLVALILPLNIISIAISTVIINDTRASIRNSIEVTLSAYTDSIDHIIYNSDYQLYNLLNNNMDGISYLSKPESLEYQLSKLAISNKLINSKELLPLADSFYFYRTDLADLQIVPHNETIYDTYLSENDFFVKITSENGIWHLVSLNGTNYLTKQQLESNMAYGSFIDLDSQVSTISKDINYPINSITFSQNQPAEPKGEMLVSSKCKNASIYLNLTLNYSALNQHISFLRWILILLSALYVILIPILYRFMYHWVIYPLGLLNTAHCSLEQGFEDYRIDVAANFKEFQQAYCSFNHMAENLQSLRLEKINNELARKQMLLDNLQLQIRPHFLLNTFNLLYSMIQTQKIKPAQAMLLYISEYFRYLFKHDYNLVLFTKEWELIEQYLDISKFQYPDAFTFHYTFDPEISLVRIPPLLLHNFIENIFSHALIHGRVVHIMVSGFYENGIVTFQIADDGCGMSQEEVSLINDCKFDDYPRGRHVGLRNSIRRLQYFYNNQGTVHVESTVNEETLFTITFLYDLEETEDA